MWGQLNLNKNITFLMRMCDRVTMVTLQSESHYSIFIFEYQLIGWINRMMNFIEAYKITNEYRNNLWNLFKQFLYPSLLRSCIIACTYICQVLNWVNTSRMKTSVKFTRERTNQQNYKPIKIHKWEIALCGTFLRRCTLRMVKSWLICVEIHKLEKVTNQITLEISK